MQFSGGGAEPKGWTDDDIEQLVGDVEDIEALLMNIDTNLQASIQHTANMNQWTYATMDALGMQVFILASILGYWLAASYLPSKRMGAWR